MLVAGGSAQAASRPRTYTYYPQQSYTYSTYPSQSYYRSSPTRRPGFFGAIMDFERRKNEFLFGPR